MEEKKTEPVKETPKAEETKKEETAVKAELTGLTVDDITLTGNKITPDFAPKTEKYTMNVQTTSYAKIPLFLRKYLDSSVIFL